MSPADLHPTDFSDFFTALWGEDKPPFSWQQQLANRMLGNIPNKGEDKPDFLASEGQAPEMAWPGAIALPTASGKTACMDIALFALASQAYRVADKKAMTTPRRIFFVVDRRVIVDQAYLRAQNLVDKLDQAKEGILKRVADNLRIIARGETTDAAKERPLQAYLLRGGMYRSEAWARNPLQPIIVASTVDQVGSRLLFRAYGRGSGTWPIYAGLIANDSLILLDEAHCAQPFLQTLKAIQRYQTWAHAPLGRPFCPVIMSATPPLEITDVFEDLSDERYNPKHPLGRRYSASKPTQLNEVKVARGTQATAKLAKDLTDAASELISEERRAIVIFVNRVATAREVARLLRKNYGESTILLTGRMRPVDKDNIAQKHLDILRSDMSTRRSLSDPYIVVATQTLEVGADLDFDGLVTECASLDALRQRFGRLNRTGRAIEAKATILVRTDQADTTKNKDDPIYGIALTKTWEWLQKNKDENNTVDFGIASLEEKLPRGVALTELNAPSMDAPVMLPAHIDCWAQTSPTPKPSPDVALFLHGPRESVADVQVCWRAGLDLTTDASQKEAIEALSLCPPSSSESLPVPFNVFQQWLAGSDKEDNSADLEGSQMDADIGKTSSPDNEASVIRWCGPEETKPEQITADPTEIRPGDVIVIPADHPYSWHQLGDLPEDTALDVGDLAYRLNRAKSILRLHPHLVDDWPVPDEIKENARLLLKDLRRRHDEDPDEILGSVHNLLSMLANTPEPSCLSKVASELMNEFPVQKLEQACHIINDNQIIIGGRRLIPELTSQADSFSDEDDVSASGISHRNGHPVRLRTHLPGVENFARRHAAACGLSSELVETIARAGLLHDVGKADPRFQSLLRGGTHWSEGEPLAKSAKMQKSRDAHQRACKTSGYPIGGRHELLSVRMAEKTPALLPENKEMRDLVLHLVASHHGYCRPLAPVVIDQQEVTAGFELRGHHLQCCGPTGLERLDSGIADRYWRMVRRYGWWGLAWLEALLRLADWRRSEWEETHNDAGE